jgi:hypothetical protein
VPSVKVARKTPLPPCWPWSGRYALDAVGESFYVDSLRSLPKPASCNAAIVLGTASLVHTPENPHDDRAIAVLIEGKQVGNLSREDALTYHARLDAIGLVERATICNVLVSCSHLDTSEARYSVQLDVEFDKEPSTRLIPAHRKLLGLVDFKPLVVESQGHGFIVSNWLPLATVENCLPGDPVKIWRRPDSSEIHLFAKGAVGGSGRLAVINETVLKHFGIASEEDFKPIIYTAGRREVTVLFECSSSST